MDNTQLKSIAVGALTGHWPAHLGLTTDAEKIEWLARRVEELAGLKVEVDADCLETEKRLDEIEACSDCELCDDHDA